MKKLILVAALAAITLKIVGYRKGSPHPDGRQIVVLDLGNRLEDLEMTPEPTHPKCNHGLNRRASRDRAGHFGDQDGIVAQHKALAHPFPHPVEGRSICVPTVAGAVAGDVAPGTVVANEPRVPVHATNTPADSTATATTDTAAALTRRTSVVLQRNGIRGDVHLRHVLGHLDIAGLTQELRTKRGPARLTRAIKTLRSHRSTPGARALDGFQLLRHLTPRPRNPPSIAARPPRCGSLRNRLQANSQNQQPSCTPCVPPASNAASAPSPSPSS